MAGYNDDAATAQKITLPAVVDGVITDADYDHFRFHADKGQTIVLDMISWLPSLRKAA